MSDLIDRIIEALKWPMAIFMLLSFPAYIQSLYYFHFFNLRYAALICGFFMFFIARSMMDSAMRANMQIIAHELTHAFFAWITFHKVKGIHVEQDDSGGAMAFEGKGNWLIIIAPYFFPLFGVMYMLAATIYMQFAPYNLILSGFLGCFIGYHLDTIGSQINEKQTDLPKVSYKFCAMFLPSANLWAIGSMLAFNSKGWEGIFIYQQLVNRLNEKNLNWVLSFLADKVF